MKITVITVSRNSGATIEETILSVFIQSYKDIEHLIVDGASSDNTLSIIERHSDKIAAYISEPDNGIYHAMNKGINMASGDIIGFLNSDDVFANDNVINKISSVFNDKLIDACYGDLLYLSKDHSKIIRHWKSKQYQDGLCKTGWMPAHPTFYVRKKIYEKYGVYNLDYKYQSDYEMTLRFLEVNKIRSYYLPEVLVKMRIGGVSNNSFMGIIKGNLEAYRACKMHFPETSLMFIPRKIISRLGQFISKPEVV